MGRSSNICYWSVLSFSGNLQHNQETNTWKQGVALLLRFFYIGVLDTMSLDKDKRITTIDWKQYRLVRVIDKTEEDIHHIISKKKRQQFNVDHPKNKIKIRRTKHSALNALYGGENQTPKSQLKFMYEIRKTALSEEVRETLYNLLCLNEEAFYDFSLVKHHKILKNKIW